ncbi:MAG: tripartite tricarboxylate transporter TctB family protein [Clostridia bacterium]|nr:tripartite tricarboxylate transporter TctB family protein [Clostridia bacterium]
MFELIMNVLLFGFLGFTFFTHVLEAKVPKSFLKNPYNLKPDMWPKVIIGLLMICLAINIYRIIKKNKGKEDFNFKALLASAKDFLKSKMFLGMLIIAFAAAIIETVGFVVTVFIVLFLYGMLLGERRIVRLLIISVVLALLLQIIFGGLLDVVLPRGTVPFLRNFALWMENLI